MIYLKLFEEFIQDPVNVDYEIKKMMDALKKFIESEGFEFEKPFIPKDDDKVIFSIDVWKKKGSKERISKTEIDILIPKLSKFFKNWIERFEKTNNLLTFTTEIEEKEYLYTRLKIDITIKGIKYFKWRYKKGEGKKLFHFSDAKNREFILKNGINPTMNKRWTEMRKDLATGKPAVYAMPSFDINPPSTSPLSASELQHTEKWQFILNGLFNRNNYKPSVFSTISFIKEGENFRDYVERSCTLVPSSKYSFKASDPNYKILTQWSIVVDDEIQRLIDNNFSPSGRAKELKIDESKFIDTTGQFKFIDGVWSDLDGRQGLGDWTCYTSNYMIDLWEIDLDKINHVWWLDPSVKLEYPTADERGEVKRDEKGNHIMRNFNKLDNWSKWLISYDGVIPPSAIKLKQSYQHRGTKSNS